MKYLALFFVALALILTLLYSFYSKTLHRTYDTLTKLRWKEASLESIDVEFLDLQGFSSKLDLSNLQYKTDTTGRFVLNSKLEDQSFIVGETLIEEIDADLSLYILPTLRSSRPLKVTIARIDSGIILENISFLLEIESPTRFIIRNAQATLLGGQIVIKQFVYDTNRDSHRMIIDVAALDLEKMTALLQQDQVDITGKISGKVPLVLSTQEVKVEASSFEALEPGGTIRYRGAQTAGSGSQLTDIVQQALSNYHYSSLRAKATYESDGETSISAQLQGRNPDMNNGQAVNVNINVDQNILKLLQSLRARRNIEKQIEQRYKKR